MSAVRSKREKCNSNCGVDFSKCKLLVYTDTTDFKV